MMRKYLSLLALVLLAVSAASAQVKVTSPREFFGFNICDDYQLVNYTELAAYWKRLDAESDRLQVVAIGQSAEGRPILMAIVSSPQNMARLEHYRRIARRLALAEGLTDEGARQLAAEGKAVVWIDGGLHATEVVAGQQIIELVYQMCRREDEEAREILDNVILLACLVNPDGLELVANWYRQHRNLRIPTLYQKYVGHDNNRDFYMSTQPETIAVNRVFYHEWFPQIVYNQHQSAPAGTVINTPPFRDPFNYNFDPMVVRGVDFVAAHINARFVWENKPGVISRTQYSTWWNGGLRTTAYFHNMIGILTETAHASPAPGRITPRPEQLVPTMDYPHPITAREWRPRDSLEYCMTANYAVLACAAKYRRQFLYNIYQMGRNSIERGKNEAYLIPADQPDFLTATKFVNALIKNGITIHRATAPFTVKGKTYPAHSYVVKGAQAFRPFIRDMFEPQKHPHDVRYPGGPPIPPYDIAGWTLAFQMGVQFEAVNEPFDAPLEVIHGDAQPPAGAITGRGKAGYLLSHEVNDAFIAVNRLLSARESNAPAEPSGPAGASPSRYEVYWLKQPLNVNGKVYPAGTMFIPAKRGLESALEKLTEVGLKFDAVERRPNVEALKLKPMRIGLFDYYGGSMPSGWTRWLLEQFEFPYRIVWGGEIDRGDLNSKYDVIILPSGVLPGGAARPEGDVPPGRETGAAIAAARVLPQGYEERTRLTQKSLEQLKRFVENGGAIVAVGHSSRIGIEFGLPLRDALTPDGRRLPPTDFFCPGSILHVNVNPTEPLAYGMGHRADVFYHNNPAFEILPEAVARGVRPVAWFGASHLLRSGWLHGEKTLFNRVAIAEATLGKGKLFLLAPEVTFRAQPHGTFKFFFNAIYLGGAEDIPRLR
ncbi:MAG: M14 family metallopeptidase [Abditibacteriales bacterium]|nr:M14 family metallopeptidase [Abditibacteriales bacterium]MDW8365506.1 M14 family metallopeptidase [Abditibacteriales bacterium]